MSELSSHQPAHDMFVVKPKSSLANLEWLVRYARHCGLPLGTSGSEIKTLRNAFGAPAWRILCRSPRSAFLPILRNRELSIHSLIQYCRRLAERSFVQAPQPLLLTFFVTQRRHFHDRPCRVPESDDYDLIRIAKRARSLQVRDIADVTNWANENRVWIRPGHKWSTLVLRARKYFERQRIELQDQENEPWHFFCGFVSWRGLTITPITRPLGLWQEAQRHGTCLFKLRHECSALKPSRFFAISRGPKALATLELAWRPPEQCDRGMDRVWGYWFLQDLRLSYNRLADESLFEAMTAFAKQYNVWAKRPGRQVPEVAKATYMRLRAAQLQTLYDEEQQALMVARDLELQAEQEKQRAQEAEVAEVLAKMTEAKRAEALLPKGKCPACGDVIPLASEQCPKCTALFTEDSKWRVMSLSKYEALMQKSVDDEVIRATRSKEEKESDNARQLIFLGVVVLLAILMVVKSQ